MSNSSDGVNNHNPFKTEHLKSILKNNGKLSNRALAGIVEANLTNFSGHVGVSHRDTPWETNGKPAKVLYITSYGFFLYDILITIKRLFMGVQFRDLEDSDLNAYLAQGRRITVFFPDDNPAETVCSIEKDQHGCTII